MIRVTAFVLFGLVSACEADETVSAYGPPGVTWQLVSQNGAPFTARAHLSFAPDGHVSGEAPCNRFNTVSPVPYPWFETGPIVATKRACPDLAAETAFFAGLAAMSRAIFEDGTLTMRNDDGGEMVFTPSE